jgi:catalase
MMSGPAASQKVVAEIVTIMRMLAGPHPGFRPVHAKGLVCTGRFQASPDARRMTRAPHLQGQTLSAIIRFANSAGDPAVHDGLPNVRSLAVKLPLPNSKSADILANSVEGFIARTPEELLEFLRAQLPDPSTGRPVADGVPKFLATHPMAAAFVGRLMQKPIPASYAQSGYHAEHAFRFIAADGTSRFGRYHFVPEAGEAYLSPDEAGKRDPNFLRDELESRLRRGPITFRLLLQLATSSDPTNDPTELWPADRPQVEIGRLEVIGISPTGAEDERRLIFDPANCGDGIELSDDPILRARSAAYSISYERRGRGE